MGVVKQDVMHHPIRIELDAVVGFLTTDTTMARANNLHRLHFGTSCSGGFTRLGDWEYTPRYRVQQLAHTVICSFTIFSTAEHLLVF
jgi:hypothetical protein